MGAVSPCRMPGKTAVTDINLDALRWDPSEAGATASCVPRHWSMACSQRKGRARKVSGDFTTSGDPT